MKFVPAPSRPHPYTINGVHLKELGNLNVARSIDSAFFGKQPESVENALKQGSLENPSGSPRQGLLLV